MTKFYFYALNILKTSLIAFLRFQKKLFTIISDTVVMVFSPRFQKKLLTIVWKQCFVEVKQNKKKRLFTARTSVSLLSLLIVSQQSC